jgi:hypothetical protein
MAQYAERSRNLRWLLAPDQVAGRGHVILLARSEHEADRQAGTVRISVCGRAVEHYAAMALMKRSPKMTAN